MSYEEKKEAEKKEEVQEEEKKSSSALLVSLLFLLLVGGAVWLSGRAIQRKKAQLQKAPRHRSKRLVQAVSAKKGSLELTRSYLALVQPMEEVVLQPRIVAEVVEVLCDEGSVVAPGQVLLRLDSREIRASMAAVKAQMEEVKVEKEEVLVNLEGLQPSVLYWKKEADRDQRLAQKGTIPLARAEASRVKYIEVKTKLSSLRKRLKRLDQLNISLQKKWESLQVRLSYCTIKSPFRGVVTKRLVDPGDLALLGKPLVVLENRRALKLRIDIPQEDMALLRKGQKVRFSVQGQKRSATLSQIFPSLQPQLHMGVGEIHLSAPQARGLTPGAYVPLEVVVETLKEVTLVPREALFQGPKGLSLFAVRKGKLHYLPVERVGQQGNWVAVKGISPKEMVVIHSFLGWAELSDRMEVEVQR